MNATQTNTVGGVCELLGIAAVVWGLVDLARYRGVPARFRAWLEARRAAIVAEVRRVLHRPRQVTLVDAGTATMRMTVNQAVVLTRERFTPRPGRDAPAGNGPEAPGRAGTCRGGPQCGP